MAIKEFSGLGSTYGSTLDIGSKTTTAPAGDNSNVIIDVASVPVKEDRPIDHGVDRIIPTDQPPQIISRESSLATYETLHHDFQLISEPVYNFWLPDETVNDREDRGNRQLDDLPRYVRLRWKTAPEFVDKKEVKSPVFREPIIPGLDILVTKDGQSFSMDSTSDVTSAKSMLANGYVAPATIASVVEIDMTKSIVSVPPSSVNEQAFLVSDSTEGLSIHELTSNVTSQQTPTQEQTQQLSSDSSKDLSAVAGKYVSTTSAGSLKITSTATSSPAIGFTALVPTTSPDGGAIDHIQELMTTVSTPETSTPVDSSQTKVKFVDPGITGVVDETKVNYISKPEHAENTIAIAQFAVNLESIANSGIQERIRTPVIPSVPGDQSLPRLQYVGYVIEKYARTQSGAFVLVDEIDVQGREFDEYIDTRVVYGEVYRYRIRSIIRWNRPTGREVMSTADEIALTKKFGPGTTYRASFFAGEWCAQWAYALVIDTIPPPPPDELTVRPDSKRKRVVVTCKLPYNPQRDIYIIRFMKKTVSSDGRDLTPWSQIGPNFGPQNSIFIDEDVDFPDENGSIEYVYSAQCVSRHWEYSALSDQISCTLNRDYSFSGETPVRFVSQQGVKVENHGAFSVIPFRRDRSEITFPRSVTFFGRIDTTSATRDSSVKMVRIESLDTGEVRDFFLDIIYDNQKPRTITGETNVFIDPNKKMDAHGHLFDKVEKATVVYSGQSIPAK